jgi:hypothetical protein
MTIQGDKVYFEVKPQEKRRNEQRMIDANGTEGKVLFTKICLYQHNTVQ